jgi:hypothetical protein
MTERDNDHEKGSKIKVTDRRLFDDSGERRTDVEPPPEEPEAGAASPEGAGADLESSQEKATLDEGPVSYPVGFRALMTPFFVEALVHLGLEPHPETGERKVDLDAARVPIELLTLLEEKTRGNLDEREAAELKEILYQVRMMYVQRSSGPKDG